jgi:hypothetical protein
MSSRTTKEEVAHLLPPFTVRTLTAQPKADKIREAVKWTTDALKESTHVAVLTHRRSTARAIAAAIPGNVVHVDGGISVKTRQDLLNGLKGRPGGVLVATMQSVGIGIDLTWCTRALMAELYWRPETIIQALGRFSRLSGTAPSLVDLLVIPGSLSERVSVALQAKLIDIAQLTDTAASENKLMKAFSLDEKELADGLADAVLAAGDIDEEWCLDEDT